MTPTNKLRFVIRGPVTRELEGICYSADQLVLQQWWQSSTTCDGEGRPVGAWRDVPIEEQP